jgi:hypothetical protein
MGLTGIIIMWVWLSAVFVFLNNWSLGAETDVRREYWAKFEHI